MPSPPLLSHTRRLDTQQHVVQDLAFTTPCISVFRVKPQAVPAPSFSTVFSYPHLSNPRARRTSTIRSSIIAASIHGWNLRAICAVCTSDAAARLIILSSWQSLPGDRLLHDVYVVVSEEPRMTETGLSQPFCHPPRLWDERFFS